MNEVTVAKRARRELHFDTLDEAMAEAERLAGGECEVSGNFGLGQILDHCARAIEIAIGDRAVPKMPVYIKWAMRLMRKRIIHKPMSPGIKLAPAAQSAFWSSEPIPVAEGLQTLQDAVTRFDAATTFPVHPLFGKLGRDELEQIQCRHLELHLSFVHPNESE